MARQVADAAFMLAACIGLDRQDPLSYAAEASSFWPLPEADLSRLRVGFTEDFGFTPVDAGIRRTLRARVAAIAPHVAVMEPVAIDMGDADFAFDVARAEAFLAGFADVDPASLGPNVRANLELARGISLADRARAQVVQTRIARDFARALQGFDLIVAPVLPMSPFPWTELYAEVVDGQRMANYYRWLALCYGVTLSTHPALSLPCGRDEAGMPFGLQVIGRLRGDAELLAHAQALEQLLAADPATARAVPDLAPLAHAAAGAEGHRHPPAGLRGPAGPRRLCGAGVTMRPRGPAPAAAVCFLLLRLLRQQRRRAVARGVWRRQRGHAPVAFESACSTTANSSQNVSPASRPCGHGGAAGHRFIVPILGGEFEGPRLCGRVRPGGADRQLLRPDGVRELDALYELEADDGAVLTVRNRVLIDDAAPQGRYARSVLQVLAPAWARTTG